MKNYMIRFTESNPQYQEPGYIERTVVPAESSEHAIKQFVDDMEGDHYEILEVVALSY